MFTLQNAPSEKPELYELSLDLLPPNIFVSHLDLTVVMEETEVGLGGWFEYNVALFEEASIRQMADHFLNLLQEVAANPEQHLLDIALSAEDKVAQQAELSHAKEAHTARFKF
jgi:non-ribosomal peptide synthetase component F